MRRTDREVTQPRELDEIIRRGSCLHLGLLDGNFPYVVPLNYGFENRDGERCFYFHGAGAGKKLELIRNDPHAAFCITLEHGVIPGETAGNYSFAYESVMGSGTVQVLETLEEKRHGLACLFSQYAKNQPFAVSDRVLEHTLVLRLRVEEISGKRRKPACQPRKNRL